MKKLVALTGLGLSAMLALAACAPTPAPAPTEEVVFPEEGSNIELVVPYSAGGTTDITARAFATVLADELGVNVEVINTPGAGGQLGITELANAAPDGYTVGFTNLPSTIPTYIVADRGATYDRDSFVPAGGLARTTNYIAVSASSPYETMDDLLDAASAAPGAITVGVASDDEKAGMEAAADSAGVEFNIVPFDGGSEKTTALLGGQVDVIIGGGTTIVPGVTNGDFRALAIFGGQEDPFLPEVPTLESLGVDVDVNGYLVVSAPAGTPQSIVDKYEAAVKAAVDDPTFQEQVEAGFQEPFFLTAADASDVWDEQQAMFEKLLGE